MASLPFNSTDPDAYRKQLAMALTQGAGDTSPVQHWSQGANRIAQALIGGQMINAMQGEQTARDAQYREALTNLPGLGGAPAPTVTPQNQAMAAALTGGTGNAANAISAIESSGRYDALGPVTKTGDRAYGKYQVMGNNIPQWTQAATGQPATPQQFLADPQLQDAVFKQRFGQYEQKYGPEGAARAWFAGEKGMNNPNAKDQLGTTVAQYGQKFMQNYSGQAAPQAPQSPQVAPEIAGQIREYLGSRDPRMQALGMQLYQQYAAPKEQWVDERDPTSGSYYQRNTRTGERKVLEKSDVLPQAAVDQKIAIAAAGKPQTTIDQRGENEFSKVAGKEQATRFNELASEGQSAQQMVADTQALLELGKQIGTGKEAQVKAAIGPYAEALGIKVDGLNEIQAYEAIVNRVAPTLRVKGSGAQSDFELRNFMKAMPSLGNTPEGNELIGRTLQGLAQNKIRAAEIGSLALSGRLGRDEAEKQLRELPDPMKEFREATKAKKPAQSGAPGEGQTATNPKTGERLILQNGKWVPLL